MHQPRTYRHWIEGKDLISFEVVIKETDLYIRADCNLQRKAVRRVQKYRAQIEKYAEYQPEFLSSMAPIFVDEKAPRIVRDMADAGKKAGVGPMAAVAGAIAETVGKDLLDSSVEVIVENGGDIFLKTLKRRLIGIYAGESPLSGRLALEILPEDTPLGICTSSGTVGHSLSLGRADAAIVVSSSTSLADAAATAIGNLVRNAEDISRSIKFAQRMDGLEGVIIIVGDKIGLWGKIKLLPAATLFSSLRSKFCGLNPYSGFICLSVCLIKSLPIPL